MQAGRYGQQRGWPAWGWVVLAIHALLLPLYGPLVDHHFAERLPYHSHVYVTAEPDHLHLYNVLHNHSQEHEHEGGNQPGLPDAAGAISIPAHELAGQNLLLLSLFLAMLAEGVGRPFFVPQWIGKVEGEVWPAEGVFLARPEEPPK